MVLGKQIRRPAKLDRQLARDLKALAHRDDPYDTVIGKTMCSNDFYEGQGRLDGAFCEFTEADKMEYLTKLQKAGVVNIEMESLCFAALTHHAGIQSAVVCVTLLDRLKGDQVEIPPFRPTCRILDIAVPRNHEVSRVKAFHRDALCFMLGKLVPIPCENGYDERIFGEGDLKVAK
jgi:hypothetical protein